jgi:glutathione synthase/RimK-type ligase-like ATP-grasp enzyme
MSKFVIIFTRTQDEHSDKVCEILSSLDITPVRVFRDRILDFRFEFWRDSLLLLTPTGHFDGRKALSVFMRTVPVLSDFGPASDEEVTTPEGYVALQRASLFSDWLAALTLHIPFVNDPQTVATVAGKGIQRHIATRAGLRTPDLYIGEQSELATGFLQSLRKRGSSLCSKTISNKAVLLNGQKHIRFTEKLTAEQETRLETLDGCPIILQPYIEKSYELRVTVAGNDIHACKISSQAAGGGTAIDWRRYNIPKTPHEPYRLPEFLCSSILRFHEMCGLHYSAFDFIRGIDGEYLFLETNPYGQWLWIEMLTGMKISESVAMLLARGELLSCSTPSKSIKILAPDQK